MLGWTDLIFSIISSQSCFIEIDLLQKMFLLLGTKKMLYFLNWWTIPLSDVFFQGCRKSDCTLQDSSQPRVERGSDDPVRLVCVGHPHHRHRQTTRKIASGTLCRIALMVIYLVLVPALLILGCYCYLSWLSEGCSCSSIGLILRSYKLQHYSATD